jgi:hypothetical protein
VSGSDRAQKAGFVPGSRASCLLAIYSATPFSTELWEQAPPPRICLTPAPTPTRAVAIARPRGHFTACAHHHFRCRRTSRSFSRPSPCSSTTTCYPRPGRRREPINARRRGYGRVGLAPGLSSFVSSRRTRWRVPHLGYLGDEESRFEILDNQVT